MRRKVLSRRIRSGRQSLPYLLAVAMLALVTQPAHAQCTGGTAGWPLIPNPNTNWIAAVSLSGPIAVSPTGWTGGQSGSTSQGGFSTSTSTSLYATNDLRVCVPVQVGFTDLGQAADADAAGWIKEVGSWTPLAGDDAHFDATVQEFVDCVEATPSSTQPVGTPPVTQNCTTPSTGPDGEPVVVGPDNQNGYWQDIGVHQTADFSGPGAGGGTSVAAGGSTNETLFVPAEMRDVTAYLRVYVTYWEGDTRLGGGPLTWPQGYGPLACPPGTVMMKHRVAGGVYVQACEQQERGKQGTIYWIDKGEPSRTDHPVSGSFEGAYPSSSFYVSVNPVALITLKYVPYAIAYVPPGDESSTRLLLSVTEGTRYAISTTTGSSNAQGDLSGTCNSTNMAFNEGVSFFLTIAGGVQSSDLQCDTTQTLDGATQASAVNDYNNEEKSSAAGWQQPSDPDYAASAYETEAFWYDTFALAVNQPATVYDDNGSSVTHLLPVNGYPDYGATTTLYLAQCALGNPSTGGTDYCWTGAYLPGTRTPVDLTAPEASALLALDPFFPDGQSADLADAGTRFSPLPSLSGGGTFNTRAGVTGYLQIGNVGTIGEGNTFQTGTYTTVAVTNTNKDTNGWSLTLGGKLSIPKSLGGQFGVTFGGTTSDIAGTVTQNGTVIDYRASTLTSTSNAVTFRATMEDKTDPIQVTTDTKNELKSLFCAGYPNPIILYPYQDSVYGGLLLRDPCAPAPTKWNGPVVQKPVWQPPRKYYPSSSSPVQPQIERPRPRFVPPRVLLPQSAGPRAQFASEISKVIAANPHMPAYIQAIRLRLQVLRPKLPYFHLKPKPLIRHQDLR